MTERLGLRGVRVDSTNRADWEPIFRAIQAGEVDLLLISPERLNNYEFRTEVMPGSPDAG